MFRRGITMKYSRRSFIKTTSCSTAAAFLAPGLLQHCAQKAPTAAELYAGFQDPPASARPFVRWWWNGDRLSAKEILRELDVMQQAGAERSTKGSDQI